MVPLRRLLIVQAHDELPYPEGTACAEVLRATAGIRRRGQRQRLDLPRHGGRRRRQAAHLARLPDAGRAARGAAGAAQGRARAGDRPGADRRRLHPRLPAVGGVRRRLADLRAGHHAAHRLDRRRARPTPLSPETTRAGVATCRRGDIWSRYVRYIGAGAVATAGIITVLRGLPTMVGAFVAVARGLRRRRGARRRRPVPRTDRDLPGAFVFGGVALVVLVAGLVPGVFAGECAPCSARSAPPASACSACCSSRSPRASWASSASPRSPPPASRWSRCSARPRSSRPPAGSMPTPAPACSPSAPSSRSPRPRPATSRRTSRPAGWWAPRPRGSSSAS